MDYKYQIVSISVLCIILIYYLKNKKLPLLSTKYFSAFLFASLCNLITDVLTVYALNHYWTMPQGRIRFYHQLFIGSLDFLAFFLYRYVYSLNHVQKRLSTKQMIVRVLPFGISMMMVLFAPLHYRIAYGERYSYGPMANTVYISVAVYLFFIAKQIYSTKSTLSDETKRSLKFGILIWLVVAVYQFFHPTALLSSVSNMLMVLFIYLSFENPKEYLDVETQTLNRRAFHLVTSEMIESKKTFYSFHIILRDMENIQNILGHAEVYDVLKKIGGVIECHTKERMYHSRSDTLTLLFSNREKADALLHKLKNYRFEYNANDIIIYPKLSIHIMECPKYAASTDEVYETLDYIRTEYHPEGEKKYYVDEELMQQKAYYEAVEKLVEDAVANNGFEVYYQPIYDTAAKTFSSAEALVRLKDRETLGYISPEIFIPIAEEKGLIKELGKDVFEKVCDFSKREALNEKGIHYIEVNLSGIQGTDKDIVNQLTECMQRNKIQPSFINLEITETATTTGGDKLKHNMERLIAEGCKFSMDDFGTGYSNLAKMADGGFHIVKLDKSLIWPCFEENESKKDAEVILNNCINMILELNMKIVAEGVETIEQADMLIGKGVNYLQGYYYSKPLSEEMYMQFLAKNQ